MKPFEFKTVKELLAFLYNGLETNECLRNYKYIFFWFQRDEINVYAGDKKDIDAAKRVYDFSGSFEGKSDYILFDQSFIFPFSVKGKIDFEKPYRVSFVKEAKEKETPANEVVL